MHRGFTRLSSLVARFACLASIRIATMLVICCCGLASGHAAEPVGGIIHVKPQIESQVIGEKKPKWVPMEEKDKFTYGQYIRTDKSGKADLLFNNGTEIVLSTETKLEIVEPAAKNKPLVVRVFGALSEILVRAKGETEIRSAACNAAVRGTSFIFRLPTDESAELTVLEGTVAFYNPQGTVLVNRNEQSTATVGAKPTIPRVVDVSGLVSWTADVTGLPLEFETPLTTVAPHALAQQLAQAERDVQADPTNTEALRRLGSLQYDSGLPAKACQVFTTLVARQPENAQNLLLLSSAQLAAGDSPAALKSINSAVTLAPKVVDIQQALARLYIARQQYLEADRVLAGLPADAVTLTLRGLLDLRQERLDAAADKFTQAVERDATSYQASSLLALAHLMQYRMTDAETSAREAVRLRPASAQAQATLALVLLYRGNIREATTASAEAITLNPTSAFALLTRGQVLLAAGDLDQARFALQQASALAPDLPPTSLALGQVYLRLGLVPKAETAFRRALSLGMVSPDACTGLGVTLQLQGKLMEARQAHQQALAIDASHAATRVNLAALQMEDGDLDGADATLRLAGNEQPENGLFYARLAMLSLYRQRLFEAQAYAQRAVALLPRSAITHYVLGFVYQEQGRINQAAQEYRRAASLDPAYAPARYALGVVREQIETGQSLDSPLGAFTAGLLGSPGQAISVQSMNTPGLEDRIQGALLDPTVVRVASRAFGDLQLDGAVGELDSQCGELSYLHMTDDHMKVLGVTASRYTTNGVRENADREEEKYGLSVGWKSPQSPSGIFALAQTALADWGGDNGREASPYMAETTQHDEAPYFLVGGNVTTSASHRTLAVMAFNRPLAYMVDPLLDSYIDRSLAGRHIEVRHDLMRGRHRVSFGGSLGHRSMDIMTYVAPFFPDEPPLEFSTEKSVNWLQAYVYDAIQLTDRWQFIGDLRLQRLHEKSITNWISPPFPSDPPASTRTLRALPQAILVYTPSVRDAFRMRARALNGVIDDFQLLNPVDAFLFPTSDLPWLNLGAHGASYEAEYDHTFRDSATLRLGVIHQEVYGTNNASGEVMNWSRYTAIDARYERSFSRTLTGFINLAVIDSAAVAHLYDNQVSVEGDISELPHLRGEIGLQYLHPSGWFVQPSYGYVGERYSEFDLVDPQAPRTRQDSIGVVNLRIGKRQGLRSSLYIEAVNLFDQAYTVFAGGGEQLQPGRQVRAGFSVRY